MIYKSQLDSVRFLSALLVFLHHGPLNGAGAWGGWGVNMFFVLSGFLITRVILKNESGNVRHDLLIFYGRRTLRIFPLYYSFLVLLLLRNHLPYPVFAFLYSYNLVTFLGLPLSPEPTTHFWTLSVEEQFYLLFPLLLLKTPTNQRLRLLWLMIIASPVFELLISQFWPDRLCRSLTPVCGQLLVWGCLAGFFEVHDYKTKFNASKSLVAAALVFGLWGMLFMFNLRWSELENTVQGLSLALLVYGLWLIESPLVLRLLTVPPLPYLGRISYGFYLFHNFSFQLSFKLSQQFPLLSSINHWVLSFLLTLFAAMLSWHLLESPLSRLKNRLPYTDKIA